MECGRRAEIAIKSAGFGIVASATLLPSTWRLLSLPTNLMVKRKGAYMPKAVPRERREQVLQVVANGATHRAASERLGVGIASISRWQSQSAAGGSLEPRKASRHHCVGKAEAHADLIKRLLLGFGPLTLRETKHRLMLDGINISRSTLGRYLKNNAAHISGGYIYKNNDDDDFVCDETMREAGEILFFTDIEE